MTQLKQYLAAATGTLAVWAGYLTGGLDAALGILFVAMGLDLFTGVVTALMGRSGKTAAGSFRSAAMFSGLTKKLLMLTIVVLAALTDRAAGTAGICRTAAIAFYTANEALSVLENARRMGVPFPRALEEKLKALRGEGEEE